MPRRCHDACRSVPAGMVITYADLALLVGRPSSHSRTVSTILGHRPGADDPNTDIPWWRVVRTDGTLLDLDQITGPRAQWVGWALDQLADEGVPLLGTGPRRRVDMREAKRMPIPDGITPWVAAPKSGTSRINGQDGPRGRAVLASREGPVRHAAIARPGAPDTPGWPSRASHRQASGALRLRRLSTARPTRTYTAEARLTRTPGLAVPRADVSRTTLGWRPARCRRRPVRARRGLGR